MSADMLTGRVETMSVQQLTGHALSCHAFQCLQIPSSADIVPLLPVLYANLW